MRQNVKGINLLIQRIDMKCVSPYVWPAVPALCKMPDLIAEGPLYRVLQIVE